MFQVEPGQDYNYYETVKPVDGNHFTVASVSRVKSPEEIEALLRNPYLGGLAKDLLTKRIADMTKAATAE